jgi:hypothetical protein
MGIPAAPGVNASGLPNLTDQASAVVSGTLTAVGPGDSFAFRGPMNWLIYASITNIAFTTTNGSSSASVSSGTGMAAGGAINSVNVPAGTTWKTFAGTSGTLALPAYTYMASGFVTVSGQDTIQLPPGSNVSQLLGATVTVPSTAEQLVFPANTTVNAIIQTDIAATATSPGRPGILLLSAAPTTIPPDSQPRPLRFQLTSNAITTGADASAVFTGASVTFSGTVQIERSFDGGRTFVVCNQGGGGTLAQYNAGTPISMAFGEPEKWGVYRANCIAYTSGTINYRISQTGGANESLAIGPLTSG